MISGVLSLSLSRWARSPPRLCLYEHGHGLHPASVAILACCKSLVLRRLLNLELLLQYGPLTWQAHLKRLEVTIKR